LNDIIKPYASTAPNFINVILSHQYKADFLAPEEKKIPDIFHEASTYKKTFHYLVTN
jgi:hypothetical protein